MFRFYLIIVRPSCFRSTRAWRWFSRIETCSPNITLYV